MKYLLHLLFLYALLYASPLYGQYTTVKYDPAVNWFNQGQPLPAEQDIVFTGPVADDISLVELQLLEPKKQKSLYTSNWYRQAAGAEFVIPLNYKLRANDQYDLLFSYFGAITSTEKEALRTQLINNLMTIIATSQKESKGINFRGRYRKLIDNMNNMLATDLSSYRATIVTWSPLLSDLVGMQLEQMEKLKLSAEESPSDTVQLRTAVAGNSKAVQLERLEELIAAEVDAILDVSLYRLRDARIIDNYATEDKAGVLALNFGYGGVYLSGKWNNGQYGQAPYAGIAIPLGNQVLGNKFFRNAAITAGVFLTSLDNGEEPAVEGFLIKQPLYLSLDYKLFQFVHLNAGAALLNGNTLEGPMPGSSDQQLAFRPFVGLSVRLNLQVGLGK